MIFRQPKVVGLQSWRKSRGCISKIKKSPDDTRLSPNFRGTFIRSLLQIAIGYNYWTDSMILEHNTICWAVRKGIELIPQSYAVLWWYHVVKPRTSRTVILMWCYSYWGEFYLLKICFKCYDILCSSLWEELDRHEKLNMTIW